MKLKAKEKFLVTAVLFYFAFCIKITVREDFIISVSFRRECWLSVGSVAPAMQTLAAAIMV
jgi:hypothetical protein